VNPHAHINKSCSGIDPFALVDYYSYCCRTFFIYLYIVRPFLDALPYLNNTYFNLISGKAQGWRYSGFGGFLGSLLYYLWLSLSLQWDQVTMTTGIAKARVEISFILRRAKHVFH
jgi:hypothetical protein